MGGGVSTGIWWSEKNQNAKMWNHATLNFTIENAQKLRTSAKYTQKHAFSVRMLSLRATQTEILFETQVTRAFLEVSFKFQRRELNLWPGSILRAFSGSIFSHLGTVPSGGGGCSNPNF